MIDFQVILTKLLEQTPVIIVLGLGIWDYRKRLNESNAEEIENNKAHKLELSELNKEHREEIEKKNEYTLNRDRETFETLTELTNVLKQIKDDNRR